MIRGISHFAIKVRDLSAAERFYSGVLGLAVQRRWWESTGDGDGAADTERSVWLNVGDEAGTFLALELATDREESGTTTDDRAAQTESGGHHLLALHITPTERPLFEARLAAAGVPVSHRTAFTIYFADPEGNRLGLSHYPDPFPASDGQPP